MKNASIRLCVALITLCVVSAVRAGELGDPAGELKIGKWVKGEPVDLSKPDHVYVIEFWATWCPPCLDSIPHLTEMEKKFGDRVTFVGVTDEDEATVRPFVEKMGAKMDYIVAIDQDEQTSRAYMGAYGIDGIPTAFVVQNKKVLWHGHPMGELQKTLEAVLAGAFSLESAKEQAKKVAQQQNLMRELAPKLNQYFAAVSKEGQVDQVAELGQEIVTRAAGDGYLLNRIAWVILTDPDVKSRDLKLALRAAKSAVDATGAQDAAVMDTYARAQFDNGHHADAIATQKRAIELAGNAGLRQELEATLKQYESAAEKR